MAGDGKGVSFFANAGAHLYAPGEGAIYLGLDERLTGKVDGEQTLWKPLAKETH